MFDNSSENSIGNQEIIPSYRELYQELCVAVALGDASFRYIEVITRKVLPK